MNRNVRFALLVSGLCGYLTACGVDVPPTPATSSPTPGSLQGTVGPAVGTSRTAADPNEGEKQDPWARIREVLPLSVAVYRPRHLPARFGPSELVEVEAVGAEAPRYSVVYKGDAELVAFIMGMGAGALGNAPPPEKEEPISILGQQGTLFINMQARPRFLGAFWRQGGQVYTVTALSDQMTIQEFRQILDGLTEVR